MRVKNFVGVISGVKNTSDEGDRLRDAGNFQAAANAYANYLKINGDDFAIWVQYGHMLKELGDYTLAREAYNKAVNLNGEDYDLFLNIGHLEKLAGQVPAARRAYEAALNIAPNCEDAALELVAMGGDLSSAKKILDGKATKTIYLDMTDLMEYVKHNPSLSGIQRVVANLIRYSSEYAASKGLNICLVIPEYDNHRIFSVNQALVAAMLKSLQDKKGGRGDLDRIIEAVYASRKLELPKSGDVFTIAGAFWIYPHYDMIRALKAHGVIFVLFIHDLIQISHPEYVHHDATLAFRRALVESLGIVDAVLTNSEFVAQDVRKFIKDKSDVDTPVKAVTLSTELSKQDSKFEYVSADVLEALQEPYVLSVSTIEVRKNHMYMIKVWESLIASGVANIPNLIFVGKVGWDIEPFKKYLETSDHLEGRLKLLHGISDLELSMLYRHANFTMFMSFVEGFGLPVGESLAYGIPCISSDRSSMPEVGGAFARYLDPEDVRSGVRMVRDLIENPEELDAWRHDVQSNYKAKSWESFAFEYFDAVLEPKARTPITPYNSVFNSGELYGFGRSDLRVREAAGKRLTYLTHTRHRGWHETENWGCWASSRRAILQVRTWLEAGTKARIFIEAQLPSGSGGENVQIKLECGGLSSPLRGLSSTARWLAAPGVVGPDGMLEITLRSTGRFPKPDSRELFVGVRRMAFCAADDIGSRMDILEALAFDD